jgi:hypothetical protein
MTTEQPDRRNWPEGGEQDEAPGDETPRDERAQDEPTQDAGPSEPPAPDAPPPADESSRWTPGSSEPWPGESAAAPPPPGEPGSEEGVPATEPMRSVEEPASWRAEPEPSPHAESGAAQPSEPVPAREPEGEAELESQPPTDETRPWETGSPAWPTEPPSAATPAPGTWPTTPPEQQDAGEGWPTTPPERTEEGQEWSTAAPERGEESWPAAEPAWSDAQTETHEPPPSEVEAYPAGVPAGAAGAAAGAAGAAATDAHSVPDSGAVTAESTLCPRCGTENRAGLAFCRNCGQRLLAAGVATTVERPSTGEGTMACPRCGTHNRAGVAFCQNCGANLRAETAGYVPPAVGQEAAPSVEAPAAAHAVLGPVVLLIGIVGLVTAYLLPFAFSAGSLYERAAGADGYGAAFWTAYPDVGGGLADQAYFGFAAPVPILAVLLVLLAIGGIVRARPGPLQLIGLVIGLIWSVGLAVLFVMVEVLGNWEGDLVGLLRVMTPGGIIFFLAALIVLIGTLTRFARS